MTIEDIKALPVNEISADNAILFIWVTFPLLQEGLDTIKAWGFEYKTIGFSTIKNHYLGSLAQVTTLEVILKYA